MDSVIENRRECLLRHLPRHATGLELGAYAAPTLRRGEANMFYCDYLTKAQLLAEANGKVNPEDVPETDFLVTSDKYEGVPDGFDVVIANHVVEHVGNFIAWFERLHQLLKPGGILFMAVPDRNFGTDRYRQCTPLSHLLTDYYVPGRDQYGVHAIETAIYYDMQYVGQPMRPEERLNARQILGTYKAERQIGVHRHVFQSGTFVSQIINPLIFMGYLDFTLLAFRDSTGNNGEFFAVLTRGAPATPVDVSGHFESRRSG
jgi:SAM-dependent methyltransferase